jgi:hypothetical protein
VLQWYERNGINWYLNPPKSPDLTVVESVASVFKYWYFAKPVWSEKKGYERVFEVFELSVDQKQINKWVLGMPDRLKRCILRDGRMIGM